MRDAEKGAMLAWGADDACQNGSDGQEKGPGTAGVPGPTGFNVTVVGALAYAPRRLCLVRVVPDGLRNLAHEPELVPLDLLGD